LVARTLCALILGLVALFFTSSLRAAPLAPESLRVSDTAVWPGELDETISGLSAHPFFRAKHVAATPEHPATKIRLQVSTTESFSTPLWDSGFLSIAPTASGATTQGVAYAGPALVSGTTYAWRAAMQDDQGVSGPYSEIQFFTLAETGSPADLRATTGIGNESIQGNPVSVVTWPPSFTAEHTGEEEVAYGQVEVSATADFERPIWTSDVLPVGTLEPGDRSAAIQYSGDAPEPGVPYFWRIRFAATLLGDSPWSAATASVVLPWNIVGSTAPAGFARENRSFGPQGFATSDVVLADVDGNGAPDAVLTTSAPELAHVVYPDIGTATPGQPILFGNGMGGRTLVAVRDFDIQGGNDVAIVNQGGLRWYGYMDGQMELREEIAITAQPDMF
jgi:hypothetical protein